MIWALVFLVSLFCVWSAYEATSDGNLFDRQRVTIGDWLYFVYSVIITIGSLPFVVPFGIAFLIIFGAIHYGEKLLKFEITPNKE